MKIKLSYIFFVGIITITACTNPPSNNEEKRELTSSEERAELYQEVIAVHDEVMPRIEEIVTYQGKIRVELDSLIEFDSTSIRVKELNELNDKLASADKAMMEWMRSFHKSTNEEGLSDSDAIELLHGEMQKIKNVKRQMEEGIEKAQRFYSEK